MFFTAILLTGTLLGDVFAGASLGGDVQEVEG